jgi:hypothetical protein
MSKKPQPVIRLAKLPTFLGVGRSAIQSMVDKGLLNPFCPTGEGGRAMVVTEDEVVRLQEAMQAKAKAKRRTPDV